MTEEKKFEKIIYCHFCEKSQNDVGALVSGKYSSICNQCITLAVATMSDKINEVNVKSRKEE